MVGDLKLDQGEMLQFIHKNIGQVRLYGTKMAEGLKIGDVEGVAISYLQSFDMAASSHDKTSIVCSPGCSYCCHIKVTVSAVEAFIISRFIKANLPDNYIEHSLCMLNNTTRSLSAVERTTLRAPCQFLTSDGYCFIYEVRPLVCRAHAAFAVEPCKRMLLDGQGYGNAYSANYKAYSILNNMVLAVAEKAVIGRVARYELNAIMNFVLRHSCEQDWLGGNNIFKEFLDTESTNDLMLSLHLFNIN